MDQVHPLHRLAEVKHLPRDAVLFSNKTALFRSKQLCSFQESGEGKQCVVLTTLGWGRGWEEEEIKKSLQSSSLEEHDCAVGSNTEDLAADRRPLYSRPNHCLAPENLHTQQVVTLGKKK